MLFPADIHHRLDPVPAADVSGIDPDFRCATLRRRNGKTIVKMDVRHQRQRGRLGNLRKAPGSVHIRNRQPDNLAPSGPKGADLGQAPLHVCGLGIEHGLNAHRCVSAHRDIPHHNLSFHTITP